MDSDSGDWLWKPVNPQVTESQALRARARGLLEAEEAGTVPDEPAAAGEFRCWLCRRVFTKERTDAEAAAEFRERY